MNKSKNTQNFKIIFFLIFLLVQLGMFYAMTFSNNHKISILYISQNEILNLEQKRIEHPNCTDKNFLLGQPERAMQEIVNIAATYADDLHKVVFSQESVVGDDVYSISSEVHEQLIRRLQK